MEYGILRRRKRTVLILQRKSFFFSTLIMDSCSVRASVAYLSSRSSVVYSNGMKIVEIDVLSRL